jgi:alkylated DNA repair dioxygenase AlkB
MPTQPDLFGSPLPSLPEGFRYSNQIIPAAMQDDLIRHIVDLPLQTFDFHGYEGKRRVISFGWRYDFSSETLVRGTPIPDFVLPGRELAARFAGIAPELLQQVLVTEYAPGAPIGWHRDKAVFGTIVGISLGSACTFRLRRKIGAKWERATITAEPGSAYVLSGPAREQWEHSIPPVERLRYSITFRELRGG